jgi:hypothetical protein
MKSPSLPVWKVGCAAAGSLSATVEGAEVTLQA